MELQRLRRETASDHERVDRLLPFMNPDLTRGLYAGVLQRLHGFVKGWEVRAAASAPEDLRLLLKERQRSSLLARDLDFFSAALPGTLFTPSESFFETRPAFLGAVYVVEGSTLGGRFIAKHVEQRLLLRPGEGDAYFTGAGDRTGSLWREVLALLGAIPEQDSEAVCSAAKAMFAAFEQWMQSGLLLHPSPTQGELQGDA